MRRFNAFMSQWRTGPAPFLLGLSAIGYLAILYWPGSDRMLRLCGGAGTSLTGFVDRVGALPPDFSAQGLALDWALMTIAMMSLLTSQQIAYVWRSVGRPFRLAAVTSFFVAYIGCWCLFGLALVPAVVLSVSAFGLGVVLPLAMAVAIVWSASPVAQFARNGCHTWSRLNGFGLKAAWDSARHGIRIGSYCVLVCWPWMLLPALSPAAHFETMIVVGLLLFADRIALASQVRWRIPPFVETLSGPLLYGSRGFK